MAPVTVTSWGSCTERILSSGTLLLLRTICLLQGKSDCHAHSRPESLYETTFVCLSSRVDLGQKRQLNSTAKAALLVVVP